MAYEEELKDVKINIAIIGQTGVGKSSFINKFRGIDEDHKLAAKVGAGAIECTMDVVAFRFEDNQNLVLWDLPGANTKNFPINTYPKKVHMEIYDAFILLTRSRFTESDISVVKHIEKTAKPFFFAQTHIDVEMKNSLRQIKKELKNLPDTEKPKRHTKVAEALRMGCKDALEENGITLDVDSIFLVTSLPDDEWEDMDISWMPENDKLTNRIIESLPDLKKAALFLGCSCNTPEKVDAEEEKQKFYIKLATFPLVYGGLIPFLGLAISHQLKALNIDSGSLHIRAMLLQGKTRSKKKLLDEVRKHMGEEDKFMSGWLPALDLETLGELTLFLIQYSEVKYAIIGVWIALSDLLSNILEANIKIAKCIIKVIDEKTS